MKLNQVEPSLEELEIALRKSWSLESTEEPENWTLSNPSRGQCGISSLIVNDYFGGKLVLWKVFIGNKQIGFHYSNELPDGTKVDVTSDQFWTNEELRDPKPFDRPNIPPKNGADRYLALAILVKEKLENFRSDEASAT
ncbi:YunG family protein [Saccharospirillum impatiens]|uniref:YunG family protein n=1 Tax=Saccharospirillum impatiens TaxID=169438 RepID=UPI001B7FBE26|nr:hypothetical protein [Saccharospirillum impatiens]